MEYRLGTRQDLDAICELIKLAIEEMERHGIYQWDDVYPARADFEEDIDKNSPEDMQIGVRANLI